MNTGFKVFVAFAAGLTTGSACGYFASKKKHEKERDEAILKIRKIWYNENISSEEVPITETDKKEYGDIANSYLYHDTEIDQEAKEIYSDISKKKKDDIPEDVNEPDLPEIKDIFEITPEEFNENPEFDSSTLWYYKKENVLVDASDNIIPENEIAKYIIPDFRSHIGDYEEDCLHIRNSILRCDFEIILTEMDISNVIAHKNQVFE